MSNEGMCVISDLPSVSLSSSPRSDYQQLQFDVVFVRDFLHSHVCQNHMSNCYT